MGFKPIAIVIKKLVILSDNEESYSIMPVTRRALALMHIFDKILRYCYP